jgi:hypothetical protein
MKIKCLQGHACFGQVHPLFNKSYTYITILRNPIERIISLYCRHGGAKNMTLKQFVTDKNFQFATESTQTRYTSAVNPPNLKKAKENLNKYFTVVGITDMFDESIFLMKKNLSWGKIDYTKKNITSNRPTQEEIPEEVINIIKEKNSLDIKLYNYAKNNLKNQIRALDSKSKQELDKFINR